MNSIVNWQDGGCIINLYCVKVIKNAKITMGVLINRKRSRCAINPRDYKLIVFDRRRVNVFITFSM